MRTCVFVMADDTISLSRCAFITVGTTQFDRLIQTVSSGTVCQILRDLGYSSVLLQTGAGYYIPEACSVENFSLQHYKFKSSIQGDITSADLVISHAGAGSVLETLSANKPLVIVINDELMDNHQEELGQRLATDQHVYFCTCSTLAETLRTMDLKKLQPFPAGETHKFATFLDSIMGYS